MFLICVPVLVLSKTFKLLKTWISSISRNIWDSTLLEYLSFIYPNFMMCYFYFAMLWHLSEGKEALNSMEHQYVLHRSYLMFYIDGIRYAWSWGVRSFWQKLSYLHRPLFQAWKRWTSLVVKLWIMSFFRCHLHTLSLFIV